jgi:hypothetical protein
MLPRLRLEKRERMVVETLDQVTYGATNPEVSSLICNWIRRHFWFILSIRVRISVAPGRPQDPGRDTT